MMKIIKTANASMKTNRAWLLDSVCTAHLCGDRDHFNSFEASDKARLNLASEASAEIKGKGVVHVSVANDCGHRLMEFKDPLSGYICTGFKDELSLDCKKYK